MKTVKEFKEIKKTIKAELTLYALSRPEKKAVLVLNNYDYDYFPPKPKGELLQDKMFQYWSEIIKNKEGKAVFSPEDFRIPGLIYSIINLDAIEQ